LVTFVSKDRRITAELARIFQESWNIVVPSVVLAEVLTGQPRDAPIYQALKKISVVDCNTDIATLAGKLRYSAETKRRKKRELTIDAIVAATAVSLKPSSIITTDTKDLSLLTSPHQIKIIPS
jgi:predicted nucleic acid-binding protein